MLITYLTFAGCAHIEQAPDTWPDSGCATTSASAEHTHTWRGWLEVDGVRLQVQRLEPRDRDCHGAVVMVPPGFESGLSLLDTPQALDLARAGLVVASWSPRGRGDSEGQEDTNGYRGQDDLAALLRWMASLDDVDPNAIVVFSRSFGGALAAGALGRHDDLAPVAWIDAESPGWMRQDLAHAPEHNQEAMAALVDPSDPEGWWAEREPAGLIGGVRCEYDRLQGLPDHALGAYVDHARAMVDRASQASAVRYNGELIEPPLGEDRAWDDAVDGRLDPEGDQVTAWILGSLP